MGSGGSNTLWSSSKSVESKPAFRLLVPRRVRTQTPQFGLPTVLSFNSRSYSILNNQIRVQVVNPQQQSSFNSRALFLLLSCFLSVSLLRHFVWLSQPNFLPSACASLSLKSLWRYIVKPHGQLVLVSSTPHNAYTPSLSTCWSYRALQDP